MLVFKDDTAREASIARERTRLKRFSSLIVEHPDILGHEKISPEPARIAIKQFFDKIAEEKIAPFTTATTRIAARPDGGGVAVG